MEILLWATEESDGTVVLKRLEEKLADRFGAGDIRRDPGDSTPDAVVIALRPGDVDVHSAGIEAAIRRAHARTAPLFVVSLNGLRIPAQERLDPALRSLSEAPVVGPDDAVEVLQFVADAHRSAAQSLIVRRPLVHRSDRASLVRRVRHNFRRRDQVLLKIAASSTAVGLAILASLGSGGASLFFFVGAVSFLLSSPPD